MRSKVRVYEDPLERTKLEGEADLLEIVEEERVMHGDPGYKYVKCRFPGEGEPDVYRCVYFEDIYCPSCGKPLRTKGHSKCECP